MKQPQDPEADRRAWQQEQLGSAVRGRPAEDPELRRMLTSHVHCGEEMQLLIVDPAIPGGQAGGEDDDVLLTYRCACGFSFDDRQMTR